MRNSYIVQLLQLMCIEELVVDMLREIDLHITRLNLCNTIIIIFIDNGGALDGVHPTSQPNVSDHLSKPYILMILHIML